ncbi:MAG: GUN4 domain-containing protein [Oculatellaceae cyanobacterium bins.114]|nr:GUN4 domain-containing protein [Oculatellaceae cyanobacterium bins.114]
MQKLVEVLIKFTPSGFGIGVTAHALLQHQWTQAGIMAFFTGITSLWIKFSSEFMKEAEAEAAKLGGGFAKWVFALLNKAIAALQTRAVQLWQDITSDFEGKYFKRLSYICRDYETQGLDRGRGLKLQQVYVSVRLSQQDLAAISPNLLKQLKGEEGLNRSFEIGDMLALMARQPEDFRRLAILGAPGSGKTTLMRYITLKYVTRQQRQLHPKAPQLIPVLLYLREMYPQILQTPQPSLADLLTQWVQGLQTENPLKPPSNWFNKQLQQGRCLVLIDGLDEVPDEHQRQQVSQWVDRQMANYLETPLILTSRKAGYESAQLQENVRVLEVQPFTSKQIDTFVKNWYLQTEVNSRGDELDDGVRDAATQQANHLLQEIKRRPALRELASNPLLLTMIATVHQRGSSLPLKRVDLYKMICEVLLEKRSQAKIARRISGINNSPLPERLALTASQKRVILQPLALELTRREVLKFTLNDVSALLQEKLNSLPGKPLSPAEFLKQLREVDALIAKEQEDLYEFAHRSFQEYLASAEIKETHQEVLLLDALQTSDKLKWWQETMLFYAAQADASNLIAAILQQPTFETMQLVCTLLQEGLTIRQEVQEALLAKLQDVLQPLDPDTLKLVTQKQLEPRYYKLGYYLQQQQWREADQETWLVMIEVGDRTYKRYLDLDDIQNFPCDHLRIIDRLWVAYSKTPDHPNGKWGFSVQKTIWQDCGSPMDYNDEWEKFGDRVGWRKDGVWVIYNDLTFDLEKPLEGKFPVMMGYWVGWFSSLAQRLVESSTSQL